MVPDGVTVVSALHTVSAAALGDLDHELDEDVLVVRRRPRRRSAVAELIALIAGLRPVNAGRLETARLVEGLTPLLISVNIRYKTHAGIKLTGLPDELGSSAPRRRHRRGQARARAARRRGPTLTVIANTGDDVEIYGVHVSPDPDLVTYWLADAIDERGWGIARRHLGGDGGAGQPGEPTWFRLGDRDLALCLTPHRAAGRRRAADRGARRRRRGDRREARVLPMCRRAGAHARARRAGAGWPFQEFMIVDAREGPIEEVRARTASRTRRADAGGARRARSGRRDRDRAVEPGRSRSGRSSRVPGMREALAQPRRAGGRGQPVRRRRGAQGPDRDVLPLRGHRADRAPGVAEPTRA